MQQLKQQIKMYKINNTSGISSSGSTSVGGGILQRNMQSTTIESPTNRFNKISVRFS